MRLKIVLFVALFTFTLQGFGQIFDPVTWSIEQKSTGKNTADIIIKAKLVTGWH